MKRPRGKRPKSVKPSRSNQAVTAAARADQKKGQKKPRKNRTRIFANGPLTIVGVGASAGGLEAFTELLKHLPLDTGMAFVLVQHLAPAYQSELAVLLARATQMPTREVANNLRVKPNHVYVIPPNAQLGIVRGVLKLSARDQRPGTPRSIDYFFESLAKDQRERSIGIILSGTATDGTIGLEAIKAEGGITFAQDETARYDSMPRSAAAAGCVDLVLSPEGIARELARIAKHPFLTGEGLIESERERASISQHASPVSGPGKPPAGGWQARSESGPKKVSSDLEANGFTSIVMLLRNHTGVDFSLYKSNTVQRRITRRMVLNRITSPSEYAQFLRGNFKELDSLYSDVLISVTSFFRNPEAFEFLRRKVFPKLLTDRHNDPVRVWVLGCSAGQEAYSLAMVLEEALDKVSRKPAVQIFATDLNEALLEKARAGLYAKSLVQDISPERLRRFFQEEEGGYRISKELREIVVFARQNLVHDPPFSRLDLIACRNVLIYLEGDLQQRVIPTFHYALKPGGFLFLGASESISSYTDLFEPLDRKHRIYFKKAAPTPVLKMQFAPHHPGEKITFSAPKRMHVQQGFHPEINVQREADRVALNRYVPTSILVSADWHILQFCGDADPYLKPPNRRPTFQLLQMARKGLLVPLRTLLNKAERDKKTVRKESVEINENGRSRKVNLEIIPLKHLKERCYLIFFEDPNLFASGAGLLRQTEPAPGEIQIESGSKVGELRQVISELNNELAETRDYLQSVQEQYEGANEELESSNEEITSANEELQSTNEELETSKEELESANEELTTVNDEMTNRNLELSLLNSDLKNLYANVNLPIVVFARDLTVRRFTGPAEKLFNLMETDLGRSIRTIKHNLDLPDLPDLVAEVIAARSLREREVRSNDGRWYTLRARPYLNSEGKIDGAVVVVVDIDALKRSEQESVAARADVEAILRAAPIPLLVLGADLRIHFANQTFYQVFKTSPEETENRLIYELGNGQWDIPKLRHFLEEIIPQNNFFTDFEVTHEFPLIGRRNMFLNGRRLDSESGTPHLILLAIDDFTERLEAQAAVHASEVRFRRLFEAALDGILLVDPKTRKITDSNPHVTDLLGQTRDQLLGKELSQIGLLKDKQASDAALRQLQQRKEYYSDSILVETKSGELRNLEMVANSYPEDNHQVVQCNIRDITERKRVEAEVRKAKNDLERANASLEQRVRDRTAALQQMNTRLHDLSNRLLKAQEDERRRISRELHDEIGQALTGLNLYLHRAEQKEPSATLKEVQAIVSEVIQEVRKISMDLHPQVLDDMGLKVALEAHFKTYQQRTNIRVRFDYHEIPETALKRQVPITLFRLVQESLTNVAKHAGVSAVLVRLYFQDNAIHLEVHDSGKGFESSEDNLRFTSGISGMRERAMLIGGTFRIESSPGNGTHLFSSVPVAREAARPRQKRTKAKLRIDS